MLEMLDEKQVQGCLSEQKSYSPLWVYSLWGRVGGGQAGRVPIQSKRNTGAGLWLVCQAGEFRTTISAVRFSYA